MLRPADLMYRGQSIARGGLAAATEPIDPAGNPYLSGVFARVDDGLDAADLPVVGKIPEDLRGVYLRNGPNVKFPPREATPIRSMATE